MFDILKHMPRVKFVNLSFNNLTEQLVNADNRNPFPYLKNLVLNATNINWNSVQELLQLLPRFVSFTLRTRALKYVNSIFGMSGSLCTYLLCVKYAQF